MKKLVSFIIVTVLIVTQGYTINATEINNIDSGIQDLIIGQDMEYLESFYKQYGVSTRASNNVIDNFENGILPLSLTQEKSPKMITTDISYDGEDEIETTTSIYSDNSIDVRKITNSNCQSGSGYSYCTVIYEYENGFVGGYASAVFTDVQGSNNDMVESPNSGVAVSKNVGIKVSNTSNTICQGRETSSKPASSQLKFTSTRNGSSTTNYIRGQIKNGSKSVYHKIYGDSGSYVSC